MKHGMLWAFLGLVIGMAAEQRIPDPGPYWIVWLVGAAALGASACLRGGPARRFLLLVAVVAVGIVRASLVPTVPTWGVLRAASLRELTVTVVSYPSLGEGRVRFTAQSDQLDGRLLVTVYEEDARSDPIFYGDRLRVSGSVRLPVPFDGFDYPAYLRRQGVVATMTAQQSGVTRAASEPPSGSALRVGDALRQRFLGRLRRNLSREAFAVAQSLLFGDRFALDSEVEDAFSRTGMMHLLAVSGLHLGVLLAGLWFGLRRLGLRPAVAYPIVSLAVLLALALVGPRISLLRAALLFLFIAFGTVLADVGPVLRRSVRPLNGLGTAGIVLLFVRPGSLFDTGFQLTFAATATLLAFGSLVGTRGTIERWVRRAPRRLAGAVRSVVSLAWASAAAQAGAAPVIAAQFGAVHPWSMVASLLAVPAAAVSLWLGILAILLGPVPGLGVAAARLFEWGLDALVAVVGTFAQFPAAEMEADAATGLWMAACSAFLYFAVRSSSDGEPWTLNSTSMAPPGDSSR